MPYCGDAVLRNAVLPYAAEARLAEPELAELPELPEVVRKR
jgi:hypothetical protein